MDSEPAKWQPLTEEQCRVVGVLIEKAKTTSEQYPLSLNSVTTGCNQKSNRNPVTNVDSEDVQIVLDELRNLGAVVEVQSGGRVAKYKHLMYEWLSVDKVELAVVAELLLRGEQTVGELRGRAARMEPIPDLQTLRPVLQSLVQKRLVIELAPQGRGQTITHGLIDDAGRDAMTRRAAVSENTQAPEPAARSRTPNDNPSGMQELQEQVRQLAERVALLESRLQD